MNQYRCETFETVGGTKPASKYRCETCGFNKPIGEDGNYCSKAAEISVIFIPSEDSNMYLGCASHSDFQSEREKVLDELEKKMDARSDEHHLFLEVLEENGETNTESWRIQHQRLYALDEVYEWIAELQKKAGE